MNIYDVIVSLRKGTESTSFRFDKMKFGNPLNIGNEVRVNLSKDKFGLEESLSLGYVELINQFPNTLHMGGGSERSIAQTLRDVDGYELERVRQYHEFWIGRK